MIAMIIGYHLHITLHSTLLLAILVASSLFAAPIFSTPLTVDSTETGTQQPRSFSPYIHSVKNISTAAEILDECQPTNAQDTSDSSTRHLMAIVEYLAEEVTETIYEPLAPIALSATQQVSTNNKNGSCLSCHSDAGHLMQVVKPKQGPSEDSCASAPSRAAFLNAFVNPEFVTTVHGSLGCVGCHSGDATSEDKSVAHDGLVDAEAGCVNCHSDIVELHATSLHGSLSGKLHTLQLRSGHKSFEQLEPAWQADCASCHASCSDCHITLPGAVGGGLIKGHEFIKRPPMKDTCALCHGSRAGGEYLGTFEGLKPDVHFEAGLHCIDCHKNDLHGDGETYTSRWEVDGRPQCGDCHAELPNQTAAAHSTNHLDLSCQTCHSQPYQNCFGCHSGEENGEYVRRADDKRLDLKIGRNTVPGYPHDVVTVRNNPVSRNSFDHYGENLLPHFDQYPTWKTTAPHNIQRVTEQNRSCQSCHGNSELFINADDLNTEGSAANKTVITKPAHDLSSGAPSK